MAGERGGERAEAGIPSAPWTPPTWCARSWSGSWSASPAICTGGPSASAPTPGDHGAPPGRRPRRGERAGRRRVAAGLSFVEQGPAGLSRTTWPEVLDADLRWRDPDAAPCTARWPGLVRRLRGSGGRPGRKPTSTSCSSPGTGQQPALLRLGLVRPRLRRGGPGGQRPGAAGDGARHEGAVGAHRPLLARPAPAGLRRLSGQRAADRGVHRRSAPGGRERAGRGRRSRPGRRLALRAGARAPARGRLLHHRFFVGRDGYQDPATHNMVAMVATMRWLTTPAWPGASPPWPSRSAGAPSSSRSASPAPRRPTSRSAGAATAGVRPRLAGRPAPDLDRVQLALDLPDEAGSSPGAAAAPGAALPGGVRDRRARGPAGLPSPPAGGQSPAPLPPRPGRRAGRRRGPSRWTPCGRCCARRQSLRLSRRRSCTRPCA